jgi:SNF2 family DNA or RNA helicase
MNRIKDLANSEVGSFDLEVFSTGRRGRACCSRFKLRCDAIGLHEKEILLLSVIGSETAVKALSAGLRSSDRDQKRIVYSVHIGNVNQNDLSKAPDGYRIYRTKMDYGLWHVLCLAKRDGFLPVVSDETIWQLLQSDRFTTPLLREWVPWLCQEMKRRNVIIELTQNGCHAGLMLTDNDCLDAIVGKGIKKHHLKIDGADAGDGNNGVLRKKIKNLDDYLGAYGPLLGKQAERSLSPLHVPGNDALPKLDLIRTPFEAQSHVIEAARQALRRQKSILLVGEMGTGKSLMGLSAIHAHAAGGAYRALIFCPGQLVNKWEREVRETLPGAEVIQVENWKTLLHFDRTKKPSGIEWYIIARDRAKLGAKWRPACQRHIHLVDGFIRCPQCGRRLVDDKREPVLVGALGKDGQPGTGLWKKRSRCEWVLSDHYDSQGQNEEGADRLAKGCGSPLWQMTGELRRYEPALFIKRRLKHFFKYLILDELHEEKGATTAQGHAAAALAASCRKVIALTGTLIGGYAEHLRPLLFRLSPGSLVQEGLGWSDATPFNERYGRIETRISEKSGGRGEDNRMSRGSKTTIKMVRPGIMPPLFGRHLIDKCVFLSLNEVAQNLPPLTEECIPVRMDGELAAVYRQDVEEPLVEAIKEMMKRRDRRLLGAMLQTLLAYPDYPFGWEPVGYWKAGQFVTVTVPPHLDEETIRPKEQALIDLVCSEKAKRRKVWVYVQYTDRHDVQGRLEKILGEAGFHVGVLRSNVPLAKREEWIAKNAWQLDVVISHPRLVETGLDLFDKAGRHNFPTICFYETGYNLFTLRQASRRSWRIGQTKPCRIVYFFYERTMQERALALMGKKLTAAQALEGKFSTEGLVTMAGEDANVEIALARSLVDRMDEGDVRRLWGKVCNVGGKMDDKHIDADADCQPVCSGDMHQEHLLEPCDEPVGVGPMRDVSGQVWLF